MSEHKNDMTELEQFLTVLNQDEVHPLVLESMFETYGIATINKLVLQLASTFMPSPSGKVLGRLVYLLTDENRENMAMLFITNLQSPDQEARAAALYGLEKLAHPNRVNFALAALRDESDEVLTAACQILLTSAQGDANLKKLLKKVYASRKDDQTYYMSMRLLEAHGIA